MNLESNKKLSIKKAIALIAALFFIAGCDNTETLEGLSILSMPTGYTSLEADFCTAAPTASKQKLKYLFILDHSTSNKAGFSSTPDDATNTDPDGGRRYGPLVNFINNLEVDPNNLTSFALINFNDIATKVGNDSTGFTSDSNQFLNLIIKDWIGGGSSTNPSPYDEGFTNFQAALTLAQQLIRSDAQTDASVFDNSTQTTYHIIFVSDGTPIITTTNNTIYLQTFEDDILPTINTIMNLKNDALLKKSIASISLNTAYYFNSVAVPGASALLQKMADAGSGRFLQFASGKNILYQQFTPPTRRVRNQLVDVFVDNISSTYWDDGRFYGDQDGDGLPDFIEMQAGSNMSVSDSDKNGINDLVEFRLKGEPCAGDNCSIIGRDSYAVCDGFMPTQNGNTVSFPYTANDGLNDCEKFLLLGNSSTFSTNGSLIPDYLALKNSISLIAGSENSSSADPFNNGLTNYEKLKLGYPTQISNRMISYEFNPRKIMMTSLPSPSSEIDCYRLNVEHIAASSPNDNIQVLLVQNNSVFEDKPFLMKASKRIHSSHVKFNPEDFK